MIHELPHLPTEVPASLGPRHLLTVGGLAARGRFARSVALRQLAQGLIIPDAFVLLGNSWQPVFDQHRVVEAIRNAQEPKSRGRSKASTAPSATG